MNQEQPHTEANLNSTNDTAGEESTAAVPSVEFDSEDLDAIAAQGQDEESREKPVEKESKKEAEDFKEQLLRTLAEFENYKKRTQKEISGILNNANEKLIVELLPVIDDLERSLKAAAAVKTEDVQIKNVLQGFEMIYAKFMQTLQRRGLRPMDSAGKELNVDYHDALMQVEKAETPPNIVLEEYEKGYFLNDKVIRHAKVIVSK